MNNNLEDLETKAKGLRRRVLDLAMETKEAHLGGSFSAIELMISLYDVVLKQEDKFILSKGHCCYPLYILLRERGYNPRIATHPDMDIENGINCTTGSLGHGLPLGVGMALARKNFKKKDGGIYVLMGDGECEEGTTWESMLIASHYKLDNLAIIVDRNKLQALDETEKIISLGDLEKKFSAFGGYASNINGHSFPEILTALQKKIYDKPHVIIANTIKGKGVRFMENDPKWHTRLPTKEELKQAYEELK
jgi:transketolase